MRGEEMETVTLCFLIRRGEVCLAMKKRGFGAGRWNGYGGKVRERESLGEAVVREIREESGIEMKPHDLKSQGDIEFYFRDHPEFNQRVYIFTARSWQGEPCETEEMKPQWFPIDRLPLKDMWASDAKWVPLVLAGKKVTGECHYKDSGGEFSIRLKED